MTELMIMEKQLAQDKRELDYRQINGITVIAYWMVASNTCTIWVHDERTNSGVEFAVPSDRVTEFFHHPFSHPDAVLPRYEQRTNNA